MAKSKKKSISGKKPPIKPRLSKKSIRKAKATKAPRPRTRIAKAKPASKAAQSHEGVFQRAFDRIRPLFKKPLDPRIRHLVEVFGVEVVALLMDAARKKMDAAHRDELAATLNALEGRPAPLSHGSWAWHELMTTDAAGAKRFYRDMFGWEAHDMEMMPGFSYTTFSKNGKDIGGMMTIGHEHGDMRPGWGVYVAVDDVDSAADKAEDLGGEIVVPAHDIPVGRWAMIKDPAGAVICLYRAKMN